MPEQVFRVSEPQPYEVVLEGDANDAVEHATEVVLAHVGDRGDLGERKPTATVHVDVGQRAVDGMLRRSRPARRISMG
jgi:hypothetical protein